MNAEKKKASKQKEYKATGPSDIVITNHRQKVRQVTITLKDKERPDFDFVGAWSGKDVLTVSRNIARAYHMYIRQLRREKQATYIPKEERTDAR